ncbi:signal-regulatory protein beta-1-like [Eublepharis macularius]|uniref:Signal-regulatory protein beta-1-like n=1 Tax=Eublepharis macularius TaxID=481883 RepID=A0AA97KZ06_EUBMA|nr:signal-regulatory protein beta-1-like [Eublepharis macularius]
MAALEPRLSPTFLLLLTFLALPSQPMISGPVDRVDAGALATFNCLACKFPSRDITVTWTKNRNRIEALPTTIAKYDTTYCVTSTAQLPLTEKDINSRLTCHINDSSSEKPLQQSYDLRDVLRVAPHVTVETSLSSLIPLNRSVRLTCVVNNFYPNDIVVMWMTRDKVIKSANYGTPNQDGSFSLNLTFNRTKSEPSKYTYTCGVRHNSQSTVYVERLLNFGMQPKENGNICFIESGLFLLSNPGLWIGFLLGKIVTALLLFYLFLRKSASRIAGLRKPASRNASTEEQRGLAE